MHCRHVNEMLHFGLLKNKTKKNRNLKYRFYSKILLLNMMHMRKNETQHVGFVSLVKQVIW